jgi:hypothetical protein
MITLGALLPDSLTFNAIARRYHYTVAPSGYFVYAASGPEHRYLPRTRRYFRASQKVAGP